MSYLGVVGESAAERVIEKSRFLSYAARTAGEEEARAFLADVRARHPMATHVCYAFVADGAGNLQRFSDDGEPQGTAGMPILGVLKAQKLCETAIAVVRYFGGIKLGAGGLTRAYAASASDAVAAAKRARFEPCVELSLSAGYAEVNALLRFLEGAEVLSRTFGEETVFTVAVRETEADLFAARARDYLNGRVRVQRGRGYLHPFPVQ